MLMICNKAAICSNPRCPNIRPHEQNDFCDSGKCSIGETKCIPVDKRDMLENLLLMHFPIDAIQEVVNQIEEIYKEKEAV